MPVFEFERVPFEQVFRNLLSNAIKYRHATDARIRVSASDEDVNWKFVVADNGPGIACEQISSIFDPFVTTREPAIGLGLSSCRSIVEAHSGEISVCNNPDYGAIFIVTLPPFK